MAGPRGAKAGGQMNGSVGDVLDGSDQRQAGGSGRVSLTLRIRRYNPELRSLVHQCQFSNCTHRHEPGCAVLQAVAAGRVHPQRYQSYLRMRFGEIESLD